MFSFLLILAPKHAISFYLAVWGAAGNDWTFHHRHFTWSLSNTIFNIRFISHFWFFVSYLRFDHTFRQTKSNYRHMRNIQRKKRDMRFRSRFSSFNFISTWIEWPRRDIRCKWGFYSILFAYVFVAVDFPPIHLFMYFMCHCCCWRWNIYSFSFVGPFHEIGRTKQIHRNEGRKKIYR